jgi:hypothetical protein
VKHLTRATRARSTGHSRAVRICLLAAPGLALASSWAQEIEYDHSFLMRTSPMPIFSEEPTHKDYNLKWGPLTGRLYGSAQVEFSDNINLAERNAQSDVYFYPNFGIGFQWPISPQNSLDLDLGMGYRAYVKHSDLDTFQISPDSKLKYLMRAGKVDLIFHDSLFLQVDPLTRPDLSGTNNGALLNYKRLNNDVGVQAEWQARRDLTLVAGYDYLIDRSLNSQFASLDRDDHTFALGAYSNFSSSWNVGLNGSVTFSDYLLHIQNDGVSYSIGPQATVKLTKFISADAGVSYTRSIYEHNGTIADRSNFSGVSYSFGIKHNMNSRTSQSLRLAHSITPGYGSNFDELTVAQYGISFRFNSYLNLNSTLSYEHLHASGSLGERADRYLCYVGTGWQIARRWNLGLGYSFALKDSDLPLRDYQQNRVTLDLTHEF